MLLRAYTAQATRFASSSSLKADGVVLLTHAVCLGQRITLFKALRQLHCILSLFPLLIVETVLPFKPLQPLLLISLLAGSSYSLFWTIHSTFNRKVDSGSFMITPTCAFHQRRSTEPVPVEEQVDETVSAGYVTLPCKILLSLLCIRGIASTIGSWIHQDHLQQRPGESRRLCEKSHGLA